MGLANQIVRKDESRDGRPARRTMEASEPLSYHHETRKFFRSVCETIARVTSSISQKMVYSLPLDTIRASIQPSRGHLIRVRGSAWRTRAGGFSESRRNDPAIALPLESFRQMKGHPQAQAADRVV